MKTCAKCRRELELEAFENKPSKPPGALYATCRECRSGGRRARGQVWAEMETNAQKWGLVVQTDGEPRVRDLTLGERAGYARPIAIRKLIREHWSKLLEFGIISSVGTIHEGAGRPGTEYWLNEEQAIFLLTKSDTAEAFSAVKEMIRVFVLVRHGRPVTGLGERLTVTHLALLVQQNHAQTQNDFRELRALVVDVGRNALFELSKQAQESRVESAERKKLSDEFHGLFGVVRGIERTVNGIERAVKGLGDALNKFTGMGRSTSPALPARANDPRQLEMLQNSQEGQSDSVEMGLWPGNGDEFGKPIDGMDERTIRRKIEWANDMYRKGKTWIKTDPKWARAMELCHARLAVFERSIVNRPN